MLSLPVAAALAALALPSGAQSTNGSAHLPPAVRRAPVLLCGDGPAELATYAGAIDLGLYPALVDCNAPAPGPWSGAFSPSGSHLYLALFGGGFGAENCRVAKLDAATLAPVGSIPVGLGPMEVVFTTSAPGVLRRGFVTNSSSSSVTVFDALDHVIATIPIPFDPLDPWGTAFPFGIAVSPDQSRVYVGTMDGRGKVFAIDAETLTLRTSETIRFPPGHGFARMLFAGDTLVLTATEFHASFQGSTAKVVFLEPGYPQGAVTHVLANSPDASAFPSPNDVALWCERKVYVAGFDMGPVVFAFDAPTRTLQRTIPTMTGDPAGKLHGIGVGPSGLLAVTEFVTDEIAWIDATQDEWLATLPLGSLPDYHAQANDVLFDAAGDRVVITGEASQSIAVFDVP